MVVVIVADVMSGCYSAFRESLDVHDFFINFLVALSYQAELLSGVVAIDMRALVPLDR